MKPAQARRQATRRKTLFPLTPRQVREHRALCAYDLRQHVGLPFYAIRQVLKCSPNEARNLVARGERLRREQQRRCTCPAHVDITFIGHLPDCPLSECSFYFGKPKKPGIKPKKPGIKPTG